jgi:6-phosphogluconate dehydrogenase
MGDLFTEWNKGELNSYLIEITSTILKKKDNLTDGHVVDHILDKTGMKGTGRWTVQENGRNSIRDRGVMPRIPYKHLEKIVRGVVSIEKNHSHLPEWHCFERIDSCLTP